MSARTNSFKALTQSTITNHFNVVREIRPTPIQGPSPSPRNSPFRQPTIPGYMSSSDEDTDSEVPPYVIMNAVKQPKRGGVKPKRDKTHTKEKSAAYKAVKKLRRQFSDLPELELKWNDPGFTFEYIQGKLKEFLLLSNEMGPGKDLSIPTRSSLALRAKAKVYHQVRDLLNRHRDLPIPDKKWTSKGATGAYWVTQLRELQNQVLGTMPAEIGGLIGEDRKKLQLLIDTGSWKSGGIKAKPQVLTTSQKETVVRYKGELKRGEIDQDLYDRVMACIGVRPVEPTSPIVHHYQLTLENRSPSFIQELFKRIVFPPTTDKHVMMEWGVTDQDDNHEKRVRIVNQDMLGSIIKELENPDETMTNVIGTKGSDVDVVRSMYWSDYMTFSVINKNKNTRQKKSGGFFKWNHLTDLDLTRQQLYNPMDEKEQAQDDDESKAMYDNGMTNCLLFAFKEAGYSENDLTTISKFVIKGTVKKNKLGELGKQINTRIILYEYMSKTKAKTFVKQVFNKDKKAKSISIGLIENHYFLEEEIPVNAYALRNYVRVKDLPNWCTIHNINGSGKLRRAKKYIKATKVIKLLLDKKDELLRQITSEELMKLSVREYSDKNITPQACQDKKKQVKLSKMAKSDWKDNWSEVFLFDTEADPHGKHFDFASSLLKWDIVTGEFTSMANNFGEGHLEKTLRTLPMNSFTKGRKANGTWEKGTRKPHLIYVHNLKYDHSFIKRHLTGNNIQPLRSGGKLIQINGFLFGREVVFKDSCSMITEPLKKFGKMFQLDTEKDVMPYRAYTRKNIKHKTMRVETAFKHLKNEEAKKDFIDNCKRNNFLSDSGKSFKHMEYASYYCAKDVEVLGKGLKKFRDCWLEKDIDILNFLTAASLAHGYMISKGAYKGVFPISGIPRDYIQKSVVGGRCMLRNNEKQDITATLDNAIQSGDVNSLYPAAMKELGLIGGYLKGLPKHFNEPKTYEEMSSYDGWFAKVKVINVPNKLEFPVIAIKNEEENCLDWTNKLEGKEVYLNKFSAINMMEGHEMVPERDFQVLEGYYYNEGRNNTILDIITNLYDERNILKGKVFDEKKDRWVQGYHMENGKRVKNSKNPMEQINKLIMNSSYGKTIQKARHFKTVIMESMEELNNLIRVNHNRFVEAIEIDDSDRWMVKLQQETHSHKSMPQVGSEILSMSKLIMCKTMFIAEKNDLSMYYTDTDSIHIKENDINKLGELFEEKYGTKMMGNKLGQLSGDFDDNKKGSKAIGSTRFIGCRKKVYYDEIHYEDGTMHDHTKMRGVTNVIIGLTAEKDKRSIKNTYAAIYGGEEVKFDLAGFPDKSCSFGYDSCGNVFTRGIGDFIRTVKV